MFRACFDYFGDRFSGSGWKQSEEVFRETLEEAKRDSNSQAARMASSAQRMLDNLPARKAKWQAVGTLWKELSEAHLKNEALSDWSASEMHESLNAMELPVRTATTRSKAPPKG
jgi:hypothetical protein